MAATQRVTIAARLAAHWEEVAAICVDHHATNVRVTGSVASGRETSTSDLDLLVDFEPPVYQGRLKTALEKVLGFKVDVIPDHTVDGPPGHQPRVVGDHAPGGDPAP